MTRLLRRGNDGDSAVQRGSYSAAEKRFDAEGVRAGCKGRELLVPFRVCEAGRSDRYFAPATLATTS